MRPGPYFLITLLLVAGGIVVYHNLVVDSADTVRHDRDSAYETSGLADPDPLGPPPSAPSGETPLLNGGGYETLTQSNAARLDRIDKRLAALERIFQEAAERPLASGSGNGPAESGTPLPSLSPRDIVDTAEPVFDDETLTTISAYMDEINRRKMEERIRTRFQNDLARLNLELTDAQSKSVIDESLRFQTRARELMRKQYSPDEAGRDERRAAFSDLQQEYASVIKRLVPDESADKIVKSRVGRNIGFYSSGFGGRAMRGGGRNRNR